MTTISNRQQTVKSEVLDVLRNGHTTGMSYFLPTGQLDRKLYQEVNEVLERIGGKWNRKAKAHLFELDPAALLDLVSTTGEMPPRNPTAFFPTPDAVIEQLLSGVCLPEEARILEPSAGKGNIAEYVRDYMTYAVLDCCEIVPRFREMLQYKGFIVLSEPDFLAYCPGSIYDLIAMNPPFAVEGDALAYVTHIEHAWSLLASGGVLRAVAPAGFAFRDDKRIVQLRNLVEECGSWEKLESQSFAESGTGVATVIISMQK